MSNREPTQLERDEQNERRARLTERLHSLQVQQRSRPRTDIRRWEHGTGWRAYIFERDTNKRLGMCNHRHRTGLSADTCAERMASNWAPYAGPRKRRQAAELSQSENRVRTAFGYGARAAGFVRTQINAALRQHQDHDEHVELVDSGGDGEVFAFWCRQCQYGAALEFGWTDLRSGAK